MWFSGPSLSKEAMKRAERRRAPQAHVACSQPTPVPAVPAPASWRGTEGLRRDSWTKGLCLGLVHRSLPGEDPGPVRPCGRMLLAICSGPGSERWSEPTWLLKWPPWPFPFISLPTTHPHELTCGRASPVWCGDGDRFPMETDKGESGGLTFLAIDGRRQQVVLNLLVLFKGTLHPRPGHELVDLSGDLPKFLQGQRTAVSLSPCSGTVLLPAQPPHGEARALHSWLRGHKHDVPHQSQQASQSTLSCPPPGPSGWWPGLRFPCSGTPIGPHPDP